MWNAYRSNSKEKPPIYVVVSTCCQFIREYNLCIINMYYSFYSYVKLIFNPMKSGPKLNCSHIGGKESPRGTLEYCRGYVII